MMIFKKCEKTLENPLGFEEITNYDNYDRPFMLCISAQESYENSIYGIVKEGARAARIRTTDELAGGFKINEMPFDFLGIKNDKNEKDLVDDFIYPFLKRGDDLKKQARKMNFFVYCDGTNRYIQLENKLKERLRKDGYSEKVIKDILSQISLISIATERNVSSVYATTFIFKDVNDLEVKDRVSEACLNGMIKNSRKTIVANISGNARVFAFNGTGEHDLKEYFKDGNIVKPSLCAAVSYLIDNSIRNTTSEELMPINTRLLTQIVLQFDAEFADSKELLDNIDTSLEYGGTPRYTASENELVNKLDEVYKKFNDASRDAQREAQRVKELETQKQTLINGIKENCSDVAFAQIVVKNGLWRNANPKTKELIPLPTDKQVRQAYEQLLLQGQVFDENNTHTL